MNCGFRTPTGRHHRSRQRCQDQVSRPRKAADSDAGSNIGRPRRTSQPDLNHGVVAFPPQSTPRRPIMRSTIVLTGAALLLLSTAPPAGATYDGQVGRIAFGAFVAADPTQGDIWSVRPDGQALRQLTDAPGLDICPAYSADGKEIAFCSNRTGLYE